ncbi:MAG: peptidoglycan-binding protein [Chloroflexota bacterium]
MPSFKYDVRGPVMGAILSTVRIGAVLLATHGIVAGQSPPRAISSPTFDCGVATSILAVMICNNEGAAAADWDLASAGWSYRYTLPPDAREHFDSEQDHFFASLAQACKLPTRISEVATASNAQFVCITDAYRKRAAAYRASLSGDALAESRLSPTQLKQIQKSLIQAGLLTGTADGIFGDKTRVAIAALQSSQGVAQTGFLTASQRQSLLGSTNPTSRPSVTRPISPVPYQSSRPHIQSERQLRRAVTIPSQREKLSEPSSPQNIQSLSERHPKSATPIPSQSEEPSKPSPLTRYEAPWGDSGMGDYGETLSRFMLQRLCSGYSSNFADCLLQRGVLPFLIIGIFIALLGAAFAVAVKEGSKKTPILLLAGFFACVSITIVPSLLGLVLAAAAIVTWFLFGDGLSNYHPRLTKTRTIRLDVLVLLLAPILFCAGVGAEAAKNRLFPPPVPLRAIFVLPSQGYVFVEGRKQTLPAIERIYLTSRNGFVPAFGSDRIFPTPEQLKLDAKDFNRFCLTYGGPWADISRLIRTAYKDAAGRDLELIRPDILGIRDDNVILSISWAFRDRDTGKIMEEHTPNFWFASRPDELVPMVMVADYIIAKALSARPNMYPTGIDTATFQTTLRKDVLSSLRKAYEMKPPADIPQQVRQWLTAPGSCSASDCVDEVIDVLRKRFTFRHDSIKVDASEAKRSDEARRTLTTYYQTTRGLGVP